MKKYISIIALILIIFALITPVYAEGEKEQVKAKVITINSIEELKNENESVEKVQNITVRILDGEYENEEYEMVYVISEDINGAISNTELKEDTDILVEITEEEGVITNINYKETVEQNYILYTVGAVSIVLILIIGRKQAIAPIIIYLITIFLTGYIFIFSMQVGWNLILISYIISVLITTYTLFTTNGMDMKTGLMIVTAILAFTMALVSIYLLFNIMDISDINIKIKESLVSIRSLICSIVILLSCAIYNCIIISVLKLDYGINKPYKTKSDNIIKGQRSLKL